MCCLLTDPCTARAPRCKRYFRRRCIYALSLSLLGSPRSPANREELRIALVRPMISGCHVDFSVQLVRALQRVRRLFVKRRETNMSYDLVHLPRIVTIEYSRNNIFRGTRRYVSRGLREARGASGARGRYAASNILAGKSYIIPSVSDVYMHAARI